jgi:type I restriction enzyme R subunit
MPSSLAESVVEEATLDWFKELGYSVLFGPDIAPDEPAAERATFGDVVLVERLRAALARVNPTIPADALEEVVRKVVNAGHASPSLFENNRRFHRLLVEGADVEYSARDGRIVHDKAWLVD